MGSTKCRQNYPFIRILHCNKLHIVLIVCEVFLAGFFFFAFWLGFVFGVIVCWGVLLVFCLCFVFGRTWEILDVWNKILKFTVVPESRNGR